MKLLSLRARGLGRFRGEVSIPVQDLGDAKVVAVVGDTGAGKTTLFELLPGALYGETPAHGNLARFANARDSYVEAKIETDDSYTIRRLINATAKQPKTEVYLEGGEGKPLSDGKAGDFDREAAKRFPSQRVFLSSAYSSQKRKGQFLKIEKRDRKALFAEMIGLGRLEDLAAAANTHAKTAEIDIASQRARMAELERQAANADDLKKSLVEAEANLTEKKRILAETELMAKAAAESLDVWKEKLSVLDLALNNAKNAFTVATDRGIDIERSTVQIQQQLATVGARRAALAQKLNERETLKKLAAEVPRVPITTLEKNLSELRAQEQGRNTEIIAWHDRVAKAKQNLDIAVAEHKRALQSAEHAASVAKQNLDVATKTAAGLAKVPCGGEGQYAACPLIASATKAAASLATLGRDAQKTKDALSALSAGEPGAVTSAKRDLDAIGPAPQKIDMKPYLHLEAEIAEARQIAQAASTAQAKLDAMATIDEQIQHADIEATELRGKLRDATGLAEEAKSAVVSTQKIAAECLSNRTAHASLRPTGVDEAQLATARRNESDATAVLARIEGQIVAAEKARMEAEEAQSSMALAFADLDDWRTLTKALGKDGVQALEIDAAGPEVSQIINELLRECFGSRFACSLETTAARADGSGFKEDFDLRVIDSEMGTEGSADELSGGEEVIVAEALSLAIAIFNCRKSSIPILDLWRDECSGALDDSKAPLYVQMLRRALDVGGFHRVWFISHQRELWDLADARIIVKDGKCSVDGKENQNA